MGEGRRHIVGLGVLVLLLLAGMVIFTNATSTGRVITGNTVSNLDANPSLQAIRDVSEISYAESSWTIQELVQESFQKEPSITTTIELLGSQGFLAHETLEEIITEPEELGVFIQVYEEAQQIHKIIIAEEETQATRDSISDFFGIETQDYHSIEFLAQQKYASQGNEEKKEAYLTWILQEGIDRAFNIEELTEQGMAQTLISTSLEFETFWDEGKISETEAETTIDTETEIEEIIDAPEADNEIITVNIEDIPQQTQTNDVLENVGIEQKEIVEVATIREIETITDNSIVALQIEQQLEERGLTDNEETMITYLPQTGEVFIVEQGATEGLKINVEPETSFNPQITTEDYTRGNFVENLLINIEGFINILFDVGSGTKGKDKDKKAENPVFEPIISSDECPVEEDNAKQVYAELLNYLDESGYERNTKGMSEKEAETATENIAEILKTALNAKYTNTPLVCKGTCKEGGGTCKRSVSAEINEEGKIMPVIGCSCGGLVPTPSSGGGGETTEEKVSCNTDSITAAYYAYGAGKACGKWGSVGTADAQADALEKCQASLDSDHIDAATRCQAKCDAVNPNLPKNTCKQDSEAPAIECTYDKFSRPNGNKEVKPGLWCYYAVATAKKGGQYDIPCNCDTSGAGAPTQPKPGDQAEKDGGKKDDDKKDDDQRIKSCRNVNVYIKPKGYGHTESSFSQSTNAVLDSCVISKGKAQDKCEEAATTPSNYQTQEWQEICNNQCAKQGACTGAVGQPNIKCSDPESCTNNNPSCSGGKAGTYTGTTTGIPVCPGRFWNEALKVTATSTATGSVQCLCSPKVTTTSVSASSGQ